MTQVESTLGSVMVAPVTGPFVTYPSVPFEDNFRRGYKQVWPLDRPLAYRMYSYYGRSLTVTRFVSGNSTQVTSKSTTFNVVSDASYARRKSAAYNLAYERLRAQVASSAGWAENLAQINKTRSMLVERSVQLARATSAIRKCRFGDAARILSIPKPSGASRRKKASQNFLEYEYGVKPLVSDIQESMQLLLSDPGIKWLRGRGRDTWNYSKQTYSKSWFGGDVYVHERESWTKNVVMTARTGVRVTNPNVFLANQLGLIDLALPWKLFPFSFIVDWFVNVEQVISSVTDWYGVTLIHPHYTEYAFGNRTYYHFDSTNYSNGTSEGKTVDTQQRSVEFWRTVGTLPGPTLVVRPFKGFSIERGAQAIALILSVLGS